MTGSNGRAIIRGIPPRVTASGASGCSNTISMMIFGVGVIIALDQLGVSTDIILLLVAALAFGAALAGGLAAGLGSLPLARQVAAGRHVQDQHRVGQVVQVAGYEGRITAIGLSTTRLLTGEGMIVELPNESFLSASVTVIRDEE